jgi:hypothetical protein
LWATPKNPPHSHPDLARRPLSLHPGEAASRVYRTAQREDSQAILKLDIIVNGFAPRPAHVGTPRIGEDDHSIWVCPPLNNRLPETLGYS